MRRFSCVGSGVAPIVQRVEGSHVRHLGSNMIITCQVMKRVIATFKYIFPFYAGQRAKVRAGGVPRNLTYSGGLAVHDRKKKKKSLAPGSSHWTNVGAAKVAPHLHTDLLGRAGPRCPRVRVCVAAWRRWPAGGPRARGRRRVVQAVAHLHQHQASRHPSANLGRGRSPAASKGHAISQPQTATASLWLPA